MEKRKERKFCPKCGHVIRPGDQFCSTCGEKLRYEAAGKPRTNRNKNWILVAASVFIAAALIALVVSGGNWGKEKPVYSARNTAEIQSVVSVFGCSCGQCDKTLAECDCPTAREMRDYIAKAVVEGNHTRKEIIQMENDRYGHLINKGELKS